jgi:myo-inositol-1(or 4)-monophosphatase
LLLRYEKMWLHSEISLLDLKVITTLNRAKRRIIDSKGRELIKTTEINASGQLAIAADTLSEQIIRESLISEGISGILYSEESGETIFGEPKLDDEKSLIILLDPLDGSQNYSRGIPFGCISMAYGYYSESPKFDDLSRAMILNLYADDLFFAVRDIGAWFNGDPINEIQSKFDPNNIHMSYYGYGATAKQYFFDFQEKYSLRSLGSAAWELALVATGTNDAFADIRGVLKAHDFAAAKIIIESVGGFFSFLPINGKTEAILDDFKKGYSVLASIYPRFIEDLQSEFIKHRLVFD